MAEINQFTLDNGLRVVHSYDPQTAMVAVNVLYDVGARDEQPELTGIAHLFEHLMFGGSVNVPDFDQVIENAAGSNNAFTTSDFTNFFDIVPAQNAETPFYLESDRMLALAFSDKALEVQRHVVIEEFKQTHLNRPYGQVMHVLRQMLYDKHPYSWPVIGITPEHIAKVQQDDIRQWFYSHYAPNNAILSVTGNISLERTRQLAEKWFGPIPARQIAERHLIDDPWLTAPMRKTVTDNVPQTMIVLGYRMDPYGKGDYFAVDAITDILSAGKSGRFYQRLMMQTDLFTSADAYIVGSEHSGMVIVQCLLNHDDDQTIAQAEQMVTDQLLQLAQPGNITEAELERSKNTYESNYAFENISLVKRAQELAMAVYHGENPDEAVRRYRSLTVEQLRAAAQRTFIDHAPAVLLWRPDKIN